MTTMQVFCAALLLTSTFALAESPVLLSESAESFETAPMDVKIQVVSALTTYCAACHGIGRLNFLPTEEPADNWAVLFSEISPLSKLKWNVAITQALAWPSNSPPPFDTLRDPQNKRDWMPKGRKRIQISEALIKDPIEPSGPTVNARQLILRELSRYK